MSIVLPQELQTQKINSLSGELRDIAEELLAEKFDIKEEVVPKRDDSFHGMGYQCYCGPQYAQRCPAHESTYNNGGQFGSTPGMEEYVTDTWRDFSPRVQHISIYVCENDHIVEAMIRMLKQADMNNFPRAGRVFRMSPDTRNSALRDVHIKQIPPTLYGARIETLYGYEPGRIILECRY